MTFGIIFYVLFALFFKHFIVDFPIYSGYVCRNQQSHSSLLWMLHILVHGLATFFILHLVGLPLWICSMIALIDLGSHYIIDSISVYCYKRMITDPIFKEKFYWIPELDQYLHGLSYVSMAFLLVLL